HGGAIGSSNGGAITVRGTNQQTLLDVDGIASGMTFAIGNGASLRLDNTNGPPMVLDKAAISLGGTNETTQLLFTSASWVLQGGSKISLSDSTLNSLGISTTLTNVDGTISGAGEITVDGRLDNQTGGTIEANGKNDLTIDLDPGDRFNNDGRLEA